MLTRVVVACALTVIVASCATPSNYDYSKEPNPRRSEYTVGPADALRINVWREPELSVETRVRPDGTITIPLVGDIRAAGCTLPQIHDQIAQGLAKFIKPENLQVTVALATAASYQFTVTGNVERNGVYSPAGYVTVLEAVSLAGGPNRYASPDKAFIIRDSASGQPRQIPVQISLLQAGKHLEQNIVVLPGDIVVMP